MSKSPTISGTITGGIQDISALLPLLGTEQCERHVGSALEGGFLYSAVTPISIFGSLGIVRASFNILVASITVQRYQFLGAKALSDIGSSPSGTVAPMIALDPKHPKRFLAESRLEAMLAEEHIDNVPALTVSGGEGVVRWNIMLVTFTLVISLVGLAPYISIVHDSGDTNLKVLFPLGLGFPILRVLGSATCVIITQFLIQIRILALLKNRLLFISINRLAQANKIEDLASEISTGLQMENVNNAWAPELAAEKCIWTLEKWLATRTDTEGGKNHRKMVDIYAAQYEQHFGPINAPIRSWIVLLLCFGLAIGCISTVIGYIGSFFLIQHSTSRNGPLVWLVLEAVLSVIRILLWAINPSWDDSKGIDFGLQLSTNPPVLSCYLPLEEILSPYNYTIVMQNHVNLEELVAYAGPPPRFSVQDVEIYFIFVIDTKSNHPSRRLLVIISALKEERCRILIKEAADHPFSIYQGILQRLGVTPLRALSDIGKTKPNSHFLTSHPIFMAEINAHYDKINCELQNQESSEERRVVLGKTWDMQRPLTETTINNQWPKMVQTGRPLLTEGEETYLNYAPLERRRRGALAAMERWIHNAMEFLSTSMALHQDTTSPLADRAESPLQQHEASETRYLLIACQQYLELSLISMTTKWDRNVRTNHANLVKIMTCNLVRNSDAIPKHKLETRLSIELEGFMQSVAQARRRNMRDRIDAYLVTPLHWEHAPMRDKELIRQKVSLLKGLVSDPPDSPFSDVNLADSFGLPHDLVSSFNASSASEQCRMLVRIQKDIFVRDMENRFDLRFRSEHQGQSHMIDQAMAGCRLRADKLFETLASSAINLKDFMDAHVSMNHVGNSFDEGLTKILSDTHQEWMKGVTKGQEELTSSNTRPKVLTQKKISDYFAEKGTSLWSEQIFSFSTDSLHSTTS